MLSETWHGNAPQSAFAPDSFTTLAHSVTSLSRSDAYCSGVLGSADPAIQAFVAKYLTGRFTDAPFDAAAGALVFRDQDWTLRYVSPGR